MRSIWIKIHQHMMLVYALPRCAGTHNTPSALYLVGRMVPSHTYVCTLAHAAVVAADTRA